MDIRLQKVDNLMKNKFGEQVKLLNFYGPVQMCVFGLTYSYLPTGENIIFECERGIITVAKEDAEGNRCYPSECFEESDYFHYEDKQEDLQELVNSIKRSFELNR